MRIGLNALYWRPDGMGGTQTYLFELLNALLKANDEDEFVVFVPAAGANRLPVQSQRVTVVPAPARLRGRGMHLAWEFTGFRESVRKSGVEVLHSLGYLAPPIGSVPQVVTVLDLVHYWFPDQIGPLKRFLWRYLLPTSLRRVSAVITISDSVRSELINRFPWTAEKTVAIPLGVDHHRFSPGTAVPGQPIFILAVASQLPHKNIDGLIRAFARIRDVRRDVRLQLAGNRTSTSDGLRKLAVELGVADAVDFLGRVDDEYLVLLYRSAAVMAFPSVYEGFGLPPLEAMASGCPVVCGDCAAVREVVGNGGLVTDVTDPERLAASLLQVLGESPAEAEQRRQRGLARARSFSWLDTGVHTRSVYSRVCAASPRSTPHAA
jgi:glycosyltransferase involved in cell wall biosynthesis